MHLFSSSFTPESLVYNGLIVNVIVYVLVILPIWPLKIRDLMT